MTIKLHELHSRLEDLENLALAIERDIKDEPYLGSRDGLKIDLSIALKAIEEMRAKVILTAFDAGQISF